MAISGNPLTLARDIADGYAAMTPTSLKKFSPGDLKTIHASLQQVLREARGEVPPQGDPDASRRRNQRIMRLNQAVVAVSNHARQSKVPL